LHNASTNINTDWHAHPTDTLADATDTLAHLVTDALADVPERE
jgi:hypothetical protein